MKTKSWPLLLVALVLGTASAQAQADAPKTEALRELKHLQEQHRKNVEAALEPVHRRHQQALEQLLRRTTKAGDLDSALKIKEELSVVPKEATKQLAGEWRLTASSGYAADITLREDGTGRHGEGPIKWHIEGTTLYFGPNQSETDRFQLPIRDGKLKGVNVYGNSLELKRQ